MSELMKPKEIPSPGGKVARPSAARNQRVGRGMRAVTYKPRKHNRPTLRLDTDCRVGLGLRVSGHRTLSPAFLFSQKSVPKSRFLTAMNQGVIAPGNHWIMDSLRGAPPPGEAMGAPAPVVFSLISAKPLRNQLQSFRKPGIIKKVQTRRNPI